MMSGSRHSRGSDSSRDSDGAPGGRLYLGCNVNQGGNKIVDREGDNFTYATNRNVGYGWRPQGNSSKARLDYRDMCNPGSVLEIKGIDKKESDTDGFEISHLKDGVDNEMINDNCDERESLLSTGSSNGSTSSIQRFRTAGTKTKAINSITEPLATITNPHDNDLDFHENDSLTISDENLQMTSRSRFSLLRNSSGAFDLFWSCVESAKRPESLVQPKLVYLLVWGGLGAVMAFTPLFLHKAKGLTYTQVGSIGLISPLAKFIGSPALTSLADYTGAHYPFLITIAVLAVTLRFCLLAVNGFLPLLFMILSAETIGAGMMPIIENGVFGLLPDRALYGKQRLWGAVGFGCTVFLSGTIIAATQQFYPMYLIHALLTSIGLLVARTMVENSQRNHARQQERAQKLLQHKQQEISGVSDQNSSTLLDEQNDENLMPPSKEIDTRDAVHVTCDSNSEANSSNITISSVIGVGTESSASDGTARQNTKKLSTQPNIVKAMKVIGQDFNTALFFFIIIVAGFGVGVIETFLFIFIEQLGGSETLQGFGRFVTCMSEIPMFWFSGYIMNKLGVMGCLMLTFFCYIIRFLIYSFMTSPWMVIASEPLHGVTFAIMWSTSTKYAADIAPPGLGATMQGLVSGLHFGLGQGLGALIGGAVYEIHGPRFTFRVSAGIALAALIILIISQSISNRVRILQAKAQSKAVYSMLTDELDPESESSLSDSPNSQLLNEFQ